jgi:hypothetical protein
MPQALVDGVGHSTKGKRTTSFKVSPVTVLTLPMVHCQFTPNTATTYLNIKMKYAQGKPL